MNILGGFDSLISIKRFCLRKDYIERMKETMLYTPNEITQLIDMLEELIDDVESLSSQLQKAEQINKTLLECNNEMVGLVQTINKEATLH